MWGGGVAGGVRRGVVARGLVLVGRVVVGVPRVFGVAGCLVVAGRVAVVGFSATFDDRGAVAWNELIANLTVMAVSAGYYLIVLRRRGDWALRGEGGALLAAKAGEGG